MALVLRDRVKETTTTTGTGTITLAGAVTGFQSFSVIGNANTTYYCIAHQTANEWEVGIGTYTATGTTLARTTVTESSNAGAAVNFSAGTKDVFVTYPAERSIYADGTTLQTTNNAVLPIASGGSGQTTAQLAMNAFAGAVTSGSYLRGNGTNVVMNTIQAGDVPTLNQNTTGSAGTLTTSRTLWGQSFNGSANVTGALSSVTTLSMSGQLTNTVAIGTAPMVITSTTRVSNLNVATAGSADAATNVAGGAANQIVYNTGANTSAFIAAPTTASTYLSWNGTAFAWAGAGGGATITNDTTTNATYYPSFLTTTSGTLSDIRTSSTKLTFNPSTGALTSTSLVASSDERLKTNWRDLPEDFISRLAKVKHGVYDRLDAPVTQVGVSAQSLAEVLEHAVVKQNDGMFGVEYGNAALVACIELAKEVVELRKALRESGKL